MTVVKERASNPDPAEFRRRLDALGKKIRDGERGWTPELVECYEIANRLILELSGAIGQRVIDEGPESHGSRRT